MTAFLAPDPIQSTQLIPGGIVPAAGGLLFCYQAGTSTKLNTYTDPTASTARANPIVLDSGGNIPGNGEVWITSTAKFVLAPFNDSDPPVSPYWTRDNYSGINNITSQLAGAEWVVGPAPTFISVSTFALGGDQTNTFTKNRRVKATVTAGTVYGMVNTSAFGVSTTVNILMDGTPLDPGLSAVSYGVLSSINVSIPGVSSTNTFFGFNAGLSNVFTSTGAGDQNTAIGYKALTANIGGRGNTAIGDEALRACISGVENTAVGVGVLSAVTTGQTNVGVGGGTGGFISTGSRNVALGIDALHGTQGSEVTGNDNTAIGTSALQAAITTADSNTAIGQGAGIALTTGSSNVLLGAHAAASLTTESNALYVDNQGRGSVALDKAGAIFYGKFNATPASQTLQTNAVATNPVQPAFLVRADSAQTNATGDATVATVAWATEIYDQHSDFNANTFTAPVTGRYHFDVLMALNDLAVGNTLLQLTLVTSNRNYLLSQVNPGAMFVAANTQLHITGGIDADMDAADTATVTIRVDGGTKIVDIIVASAWSGHLVC